jgi:hypothetical protein
MEVSMNSRFSFFGRSKTWRAAGAIAVTAALGIGFGATSASANSEFDVARLQAALVNAGVETSSSGGMAPAGNDARVAIETGLTLPPVESSTPDDTITTRPVTESSAASMTSGGLALFANTDSSAFALSASDAAGYSISLDAGAPTEYSYRIEVGGEPAVLELTEGGGVSILDRDGAVVNSILPPWAKDAAGAEVATHYTVEGDTLTQHVQHEGAAYPVVADPRFVCSGVFCTLELTRAETRSLANNALGAGAACALMGPGAPVCAALLVGMWAQAKIAISRGQCVGVRGVRAAIVTGMHGVYIPCYA